MVAKAFALITTVIPAGLIPLTRDREHDSMPIAQILARWRHDS